MKASTTRAGAITNNRHLSYVFDFGDIMRATKFMAAGGDIMDPKKKAGKMVQEEYFAWMQASIEEDMTHFGRLKASKIAHVYLWDSVIDRTETRPKNINNFVDSNNKFIPRIDVDARLWYLERNKRGRNIYLSDVVFAEHDSIAVYDDLVYSVGWLNPEGLGQHVFFDQARELEYTKVIEKRSSNVSKRRINSVGTGKNPARIIQMYEGDSGDYVRPKKSKREKEIAAKEAKKNRNKRKKKKGKKASKKRKPTGGSFAINVVNYQRDNQFYQRFAEFFAAYVSSNAVKNAKQVTTEASRIIAHVFNGSAAVLTADSRRAAAKVLAGGMNMQAGTKYLKASVSRSSAVVVIDDKGRPAVTKFKVEKDLEHRESIEIATLFREKAEVIDRKLIRELMKSPVKAYHRKSKTYNPRQSKSRSGRVKKRKYSHQE